MRARPSRLGPWLLRPFLEGGEAHPLLGDLEEEFHTVIVPERGVRAARRWHLRQSVASMAPLLGAGIERPTPRQWLLALATLGALVWGPLRCIEALRSFVLGQIPLKDGLLRSPAYLAATLVAAALVFTVASWVLRRDARLAPVPTWCIVVLAWLLLGLVGPHWPLSVWAASLPVLGLGAWVSSRLSGARTDEGFEGEGT
jgi:hypothetical protein